MAITGRSGYHDFCGFTAMKPYKRPRFHRIASRKKAFAVGNNFHFQKKRTAYYSTRRSPSPQRQMMKNRLKIQSQSGFHSFAGTEKTRKRRLNFPGRTMPLCRNVFAGIAINRSKSGERITYVYQK
jgi:hypothetical protein